MLPISQLLPELLLIIKKFTSCKKEKDMKLKGALKLTMSYTQASSSGPNQLYCQILNTGFDLLHIFFQFIDIRVACLGNVDVGKSTLLSVLSYGDLDDGRGRARLNMFRHLHEIQSGRTSCISQEILAFDSQGEVSTIS